MPAITTPGQRDEMDSPSAKLRLLSSPHLQAAAVSALCFGVYVRTLAPTVNFIDAGELGAVACTLGIAHPSGYPLFTLLGWMFCQLPIAAEKIVRLNLMSAFFCAVGLFFFFLLVRHLLGLMLAAGRSLKPNPAVAPTALLTIASAAASLMLGFSKTYWSMATSLEVYSLHGLFLALVTYAFLRANFPEPRSPADQGPSKKRSNKLGHQSGAKAKSQPGHPQSSTGQDRWWGLFALTLGLSFTNHMTTMLLAPGFLYLYFARQGANRNSWKRLMKLGLPFALGLSVYLYLPLRAMQEPIISWGTTNELDGFLSHLSGKQYRVWMFTSWEVAGKQLLSYLKTLPVEFAYVGPLLAALGALVTWRAYRQLGLFLGLLFLGCVLYAINYDIHDIASYFLLANLCMAVWIGVAVAFGLSMFARNLSSAAAAGAVLGLAPALTNFSACDEDQKYLVEDYTLNMFDSFRPQALVFSFQWDYWVSASYYYQQVKRLRPDVVVIDKELLRRSWYLRVLSYAYPSVMDSSRAEIDDFLVELNKFERGLPYSPPVIEGKFNGMIRALITNNMKTRPVYVTEEIEPELVEGFQRVPEGLALRLEADNHFHETRRPQYRYRPWKGEGRLESLVPRFYAASLGRRGNYYAAFAQRPEALASFKEALVFDPSSKEAQAAVRALESGPP